MIRRLRFAWIRRRVRRRRQTTSLIGERLAIYWVDYYGKEGRR